MSILKLHVVVAMLALVWASAAAGAGAGAERADRAPHHPPAAAPHHEVKHPPAAHPRRRSGCISQRGTILVVQAHRAVPLSAIRAEAERRGNGEIIGARLCRRGGRLTYLVSVLSERGKVVHINFDAATGRLIAAAH